MDRAVPAGRGDLRTYEDKGAKRVWIAGSKADDGKRFCTLQICARSAVDPSKPRRGQPKIAVIFRGQGKRISAEERPAYHPDVLVRFQPKAWADEEYVRIDLTKPGGLRFDLDLTDALAQRPRDTT